MDTSQEMREILEATLTDFQSVQVKQRQLVEKCQKELRYLLKEVFSAKLRQQLQEHFEKRNEILEHKIGCMDEAINVASDKHDVFVGLRTQLVEVFDEVIKPEMTIDNSEPSVAGHSMADFETFPCATKEQVMLVNSQQERYEALLSQVEEKVLSEANRILQEMEAYLIKTQAAKEELFNTLSRVVVSEIDKLERLCGAHQVMESQLKSLCDRLPA